MTYLETASEFLRNARVKVAMDQEDRRRANNYSEVARLALVIEDIDSALRELGRE